MRGNRYSIVGHDYEVNGRSTTNSVPHSLKFTCYKVTPKRLYCRIHRVKLTAQKPWLPKPQPMKTRRKDPPPRKHVRPPEVTPASSSAAADPPPRLPRKRRRVAPASSS